MFYWFNLVKPNSLFTAEVNNKATQGLLLTWENWWESLSPASRVGSTQRKAQDAQSQEVTQLQEWLKNAKDLAHVGTLKISIVEMAGSIVDSPLCPKQPHTLISPCFRVLHPRPALGPARSGTLGSPQITFCSKKFWLRKENIVIKIRYSFLPPTPWQTSERASCCGNCGPLTTYHASL